MQTRPNESAVSRRGIFYGWWVVVAGFLINFYTSGTFFYGFAAFFSPLQNDLNLSATAISVAFALRSVEGGMEGLLVGYLVTRMEPRRIMVVGVLLAGVGMFLLGRAHSLWTFIAAFLVVSMGVSACSGLVPMTAVSYWFARKRSRALALYSTGAGVSGTLAPALVWLIDRSDWRTTMSLMAVGMLAIGIPAALAVRGRPEGYGLLPDGDAARAGKADSEEAAATEFTLRQTVRTRSFWFLAAAFLCVSGVLNALAVHQIRYLESVDISRGLAGLVVTVMTISSVVGRLGFGWLGDFVEKRYVLAITFGLQAIGLAIFASLGAAWLLIPYLMAFGPSYGGTIPLRPAILADYFGRKALGTIQGVMSNITLVGTISSPIVAGWVFDRFDTYRPAFYAMAALAALAIPLVLVAKRPQARPRPG